MKTAAAQDLRDQIRQDVRAGRTPAVDGDALPPGCIALDTPHVPTVVHVREIAGVHKVKPTGTLSHLQGLVELHDGTRHAVPDGRVVVEAIHRIRKERRA